MSAARDTGVSGHRQRHHGPAQAGPVEAGVAHVLVRGQSPHKHRSRRLQSPFAIGHVGDDGAGITIHQHHRSGEGIAPEESPVSLRNAVGLVEILPGEGGVSLISLSSNHRCLEGKADDEEPESVTKVADSHDP